MFDEQYIHWFKDSIEHVASLKWRFCGHTVKQSDRWNEKYKQGEHRQQNDIEADHNLDVPTIRHKIKNIEES